MKILVTGSSGHLGEALIRVLGSQGFNAVGIDVEPSTYTAHVGSIADRAFVHQCMQDVETVLHTATLHKPHIVTHSKQDFIDTNVTGTLNLLEEAAAHGIESFIYTSTTSTFGDVILPRSEKPATWITEDIVPIPKNIYGATKLAAENLCRLFYRDHHLPCLILRTSRFFPEEDDKKEMRDAYTDANIKANEFLYRRVDIEDVVSAHLLAIEKAQTIGFRKYIISATTPFSKDQLVELRSQAPAVVQQLFPRYEKLFSEKGWKMFPGIDRVYVNERARKELDWKPVYDFQHVLDRLGNRRDYRSPLALAVGRKGYHDQAFDDGPFPV